MSSTYYKLYIKEVLDLAKTLVIKSVASAESINTHLVQLGLSVDESSPQTWKYYLNLAGEYHSTDTMMYVDSTDTAERIAFTKANLEEHRETRRDYAYGSSYYEELIRQYPNQEQLIQGILNPIDITTAIEGRDGQILYYNKALVESNEESLIPNLQKFIDGYFIRWVINDYTKTDDLYAATYLGILFLQLPNVILNLRLKACHTNEAHSFHIREYLASNGQLDGYMDTLTKKQALMLYRNIKYIQRNAGKTSTFEFLIQRLLTERGLPIAAYQMRHNLANQPDNLYPDIELLRSRLNLDYATVTVDNHTVEDVLTKEIPLAKDNYTVQSEALETITEDMRNSLVTHLPTKVLESDILDLSDSAPFTLSDTLLNHWLFFSTNNRYPTLINFNNPQTGERIQVTAKDAFVIFLYSYNRSFGVTLDRVPNLEATHVRRTPLPTRAELKSIVDPAYVSDKLVLAALMNQPSIGRYISTESFYDACVEIHTALMRHRDLYAYREHYIERGHVEAMVGRCYQDILCNLGDEQPYEDWFKDRGLRIPELSTLDQGLLAAAVLKEATGIGLNTNKSLRELQESMIRLMTQLSSYSVQYIATINTSAYQIADWAVIRLGDDHTTATGRLRLNEAMIDVRALHARGYGKQVLPTERVGVEMTASAHERVTLDMGFGLDFTMTSLGSTNYKGEIPNVYFDVHMPEGMDTPPVFPLSAAITVTDLSGLTPPEWPLSEVITKTQLSGVENPEE